LRRKLCQCISSCQTSRTKAGRQLRENQNALKKSTANLNFGVKVLHQYATLGPHDFVNIVDAPDNKTIARLSIELGYEAQFKS